MRSLYSLDSKCKVKYPFSQNLMDIFPWILSDQFLSTHLWRVFGDGHRPVNWPMSPFSTRERAAVRGSIGGKFTSCKTSNFLTNLETAGWGCYGGRDLIRLEKACCGSPPSGGASGGPMAGGRRPRLPRNKREPNGSSARATALDSSLSFLIDVPYLLI